MGFVIQAEGASAVSTLDAPPARRRIGRGSPQQEDFWDELVGGTSHLLLEARAGTGKSTSCAEGMHRLPRRLGLTYCAFNKAIATEFQERHAPANCRASTMHSLGYAAVRNAFGDVAINDFKTADLAEKYFPRKFEDRPARMAAAAVVSLCKANLVDGEDEGELADLAGSYGVDLGDDREDVLAVVPELIRESRETTSVIDFDDMIWLPAALGLACRPCDVLFVDEAQDVNRCQQALIPLLCPGGRIVVVGDPRQSIYRFRGADAESIANLSAQLGETSRGLVRRPLTVTWRCPASHVRLANALVPDLEAAPGAKEGTIEEVGPSEALKLLRPGDMALCRTNAPLVSACYRMLKDGIPAVIRGRDIGKGLLTLVARLRARTIPDLIERLDDYQVAESAKLRKLRHPGPALVALQDKVSCLLAMTEGLTSVDELKARIEGLFVDVNESNAVLLSSIHRAKGLERDTVAILCPEQLPHPMATHPAEAAQEENLAYVAATRSKDRLIFAGPVPALFNHQGA